MGGCVSSGGGSGEGCQVKKKATKKPAKKPKPKKAKKRQQNCDDVIVQNYVNDSYVEANCGD